MKRRYAWLVAASLLLVAALGAAWDAPRDPRRLVDFFEADQTYFLDTFADGYQLVKLDEPTEQALRATRNDEDFRTRVYRVIRHGEDFVHFRSASEETDVILPASSIRRLSYRVVKQFD